MVDVGGDPLRNAGATIVPFPKGASNGPRREPNEHRRSSMGGAGRQSRARREGQGGGGPPPPCAPGRGGEKAPPGCSCGLPGGDRSVRSEQLSGCDPQEREQLSGCDLDDLDFEYSSGKCVEKRDRRINPRTGRRYTVADLPERAGKACRHCHELGARDWWIWTWKTGQGVLKQRRPYRCGSYRCPVCRKHDAHVQFARITKSSEPLDPRGWCFLVNTLDRLGTYSGKRPWKNQDEAFKDLQRIGQEFMRSLRRWFKQMGWEPLRNTWVSTTEAHRSGWPHQNWMIWHPQFADWLDEEKAAKEHEGITGRDAILASRQLADVLSRAGFGPMSTAERAKSADALASYVVKLAGEADGLVGEVTKLCQLPINSPLRFRRLRSGKGFLPPRKHAPDTVTKLCGRLTTWADYMSRNQAALLCADDLLATFRVEWPDSPPKELSEDGRTLGKRISEQLSLRSDDLKAHSVEGQLVAVSRGGRALGHITIALEQSPTTGALVRRTRWEGIPMVLGIHRPPAGEEDAASEVRTIEQEEWETEEVQRAEFMRAGKPREAERVGLPPITAWVNGKKLERLARCGRVEKKESLAS